MQKSTVAFLVLGLILLSAFGQSSSDSPSKVLLETSFIAGNSGGDITREQLFKADRLYVYKYDSPAHRVIRFKLSVISKRYDVLEIESNSGMFSAEIITYIHKCIPGDRLIFEYVKYVNLQGDTLKAKPLTLSVK